MNFDPSIIKIHPLIQELRAEFGFPAEPQQRNPHVENYWFCLKPEKRDEYLKKTRLYCFSDEASEDKKAAGPLPDWIPGYARKSGESIKDELKIVLTRFQRKPGNEEAAVSLRSRKGPVAVPKPCSVVKKIKKPEKSVFFGKKFIIEIDE